MWRPHNAEIVIIDAIYVGIQISEVMIPDILDVEIIIMIGSHAANIHVDTAGVRIPIIQLTNMEINYIGTIVVENIHIEITNVVITVTEITNVDIVIVGIMGMES